MQTDVSADIEEMETECHDQASSSSSTSSSSAVSAADKTSSALQQSKEPESGAGGYTMMKLLTTKELRLPLLITCVLQIAQQLSGINAVRRTFRDYDIKSHENPMVAICLAFNPVSYTHLTLPTIYSV